MCPPEVASALCKSGITRRNLFKTGLGAGIAAAATLLPGERAHAAPARQLSFRNLADLTHVLGPGTPGFPGLPGFTVTPHMTHDPNGFYGNVLSYWEHNGTHIDAPIHFVADGLFVDQIPAEELVAPIAVIDIKERAASDPDTQVSPDDILAWERRYGRLPQHAIVAMNSGWASRIGSVESYRNTDSGGTMHFPGFSKAAIEFMLAERSINGIAVDTLSLDHGAASVFEAHVALLSANRWGIENIGNLDAIPPSGASVFVGAPKVASGSGGPARVLALW